MIKRNFGRMVMITAMATLLMLPAGNVFAQCAAPSDGLVGHWKLDETSGNFADSSGNGLTGTPDSINYNQPGKIGAGVEFPSNGSDINVGTSALLDIPNGTIAAWFYFDDFSVSTSNGTLISKNASGNNDGDLWFRVSDSTDEVLLRITDGGGDTWITSNAGILQDATWHHAVATFGTGGMKLYIDGVLQDDTDPLTRGMENAAANLYIGNVDGAAWKFGPDNYIDDVRIYNRVLSDNEISALYSQLSSEDAAAGEIVFNVRHALMQYCDGTNWRVMATGPYNPNAVEFDGNDYLVLGSNVGPASTTKWTGSLWFRRTIDNGIDVFLDGGSIDISIDILGDDTLLFMGNSAADAPVLNASSTATISDTNWHHLLFSFDTSDTSKRHLYIDGVADTLSIGTYDTATPMSYSTTAVIGRSTGGSLELDAEVADFWIDFGTYIDLSIESNRRKFVSANGMPMYLGADGSIPTGSAPDIFLTGETSDWHTNKGSGGGFTENGALTTALSQPADTVFATGEPALENLIGHWKLDETTGTSIIDYASSNNGSVQGGLSPVTSTVPGWIGSALYFDENNSDYIQTTNTYMNTANDVTLSAWVYATDPVANDYYHILWSGDGTGNGGGAEYEFSLMLGAATAGYSDDLFQFHMEVEGSAGDDAADINIVAGPTSRNAWHHIVVTVENMNSGGPAAIMYIDGVEVDNDTAVGAIPRGTWDTALRIGADGAEIRTFEGYIDDVRMYDSVLTADEVRSLYNSGVPGKIQYNEAYSVMEYFNGTEWVAMGPIGATPKSEGLVGRWRLDDGAGSGTAADDTGNGNTGTLVSMDTTNDWIGGKINSGVQVDGVGGHISVANPASFEFGADDFTIAGWIKRDPSGSGEANLIMKTDAPGSWVAGGKSLYLADSSEGYTIIFDAHSVGTYPADTAVNDSGWHHIAVAFDDSGDHLKFYLDGKADGEAFGVSLTADNPAHVLLLGAAGTETALDDVRFYDVELIEEDIERLYLYGVAGGLGDIDNGCTSPVRPEGVMLYNIDNDVMQYCNGAEWIRMGQ